MGNFDPNAPQTTRMLQRANRPKIASREIESEGGTRLARSFSLARDEAVGGSPQLRTHDFVGSGMRLRRASCRFTPADGGIDDGAEHAGHRQGDNGD
jgi:hypothetical protein